MIGSQGSKKSNERLRMRLSVTYPHSQQAF